ncbi:hypothetical protein BD311DRAFT_656505, partial [Dichomitus squalens]
CFVCWGSGHDSRSCYLNKTCGKCGQRGHPSRLCTEREVRRRHLCKNCFKSGHEHWECTEPKGYSEMRCERCDRPGHVALDCPTLKRPVRAKCTHTRLARVDVVHQSRRNRRNRPPLRSVVNAPEERRPARCVGRKVICAGSVPEYHVLYVCSFLLPYALSKALQNCGGSGHEFKACPPQSKYSPRFSGRSADGPAETEARRPTASTSRCVLCGSHEHSSG